MAETRVTHKIHEQRESNFKSGQTIILAIAHNKIG